MTARPLTDAQIARALRAHLPQHAQAGLEARILSAAAQTPQQASPPSFLASLWDADPLARRRSQVVALALLLALLAATIAGVGAMLERQRSAPDLSLDRPVDVEAYVRRSYDGIAELPALTLTVLEVEGTKTRWTHNGAGILRLDHYDSPTAASPTLFRLYTDGQMAEEADLDGEPVWVEYAAPGVALAELAMATGTYPFCESGWAYVDLAYLIGRPTHHVACGASALWLDIETGLALKSIRAQDPAIGPTIAFDVIELIVGPQPDELFVTPVDRRTVSGDEFNCALDPGCVASPAGPSPTPRPLVTPPPADGQFAVPLDLEALVADVIARSRAPVAVEILYEEYQHPTPGGTRSRDYFDGAGRSRSEYIFDLTGGEPPTIYLNTGEGFYESYGLTSDGRTLWQAWPETPPVALPMHGLDSACRSGWEHRGFDRVAGRAAHHLVCGYNEYWIDVEWQLVVRHQRNPAPLERDAFVEEVLELEFGDPPSELFELPADAVVCEGRPTETCNDPTGAPDGSPAPTPES